MKIADSSEAASRPRFGLKSLFVLLTAAAIVLTPAHWFGARYLISAAFSVGLVLVCLYAYGPERRPAALVAALVGAIVGLPLALGIIVYFEHAFFNFLLCIPLVIFRPRRVVFAVAMVGLMVIVYGFEFVDGVEEHRRLEALKLRYPFESLAQRLEFEKQSPQSNAEPDRAIRLAASVTSNLDAQEQHQQMRYDRRVWQLRQLHEATYDHFEQIADLGYSRMPTLRRIVLERETRSPLTLPYAVEIKEISDSTELFGVHFAAVDKFARADRQGYVRNLDEVAGFEPHGLESTPDPNPGDGQSAARWQVSRLELVSLLRHEGPLVYVAETMPTMDQLADVPVRALNDFERRALPQLETESDIAFSDHTERVLMLGAVRAGKTCIECHEGQRGKLLGAFSYEITPVGVAANATASNSR